MNPLIGGVSFGPSETPRAEMLWPFIGGALLATLVIVLWIWRKK